MRLQLGLSGHQLLERSVASLVLSTSVSWKPSNMTLWKNIKKNLDWWPESLTTFKTHLQEHIFQKIKWHLSQILYIEACEIESDHM